MYFGFALDMSGIDLWDIDLLDTDLNLLDTDIPGKHFVCLQDVLKTSWRHVFKTSSRNALKTSWRLFTVTIFCLPRRLQEVLREAFKMPSKLFASRHLQNFLKTIKCLLGNVHDKDWLIFSGGTDRPGELCYNFSISNDLTEMVNFSTPTFPPLGNSHRVISVSIDFPSNSKPEELFHCIAYDYSCVDWDSLCDNLREVTWEDICKLCF